MGAVGRFLTGGSKSKQKSQSTSTSTQSSRNLAFPWLQEKYSGAVDQGNEAMSSVSALLGLGGDSGAATRSYNDYLKSTDYDFTTKEGGKAITNNQAAKGLLGSGSTLRRLQEFGQGTAQKYFGDYIQRLLGLIEGGQRGGQIVSGAGNESLGMSDSQSTGSGSSSSIGGLPALFGSLAPKGG